MQILQVDLENVKSYDHASIAFGPGTNAICGHNGAGKSTVLEAIGFTLFDYLAVSQADFVREGEKSATVTVHVAGRDNRTYQVVRRCGSSSQHYVYDPELDQKLADGKQETMAWLRELMGTDGTGDLNVLFRDAVGVPQGLLTAAFLDTPARRKDTFNPLLRVDEYERVWEGLREPARYLEHQIADQQARIAGLEAQVEALPDLRERLARLTADIETGEAQQVELIDAKTETAADLAVLAARKEQLDALDQALAQAGSDRQATQVRLETARTAVVSAEAAQAIVAAAQAGHDAYLEAQRNQDALEEARAARDTLVGERQAAQQALAVVEERASQLDTELTAIDDAKTTMEHLAPDVARQEMLEAEFQAAQRDADRLVSAQQSLEREKVRLTELKLRHDAAAAQAAVRARQEAALAETKASLADWVEKRDDLATEVTGIGMQKSQTEAQIAGTVRRLEAAERRLDQERDRLAQLAARLETVQGQLAGLADVESAIQAAHETIETLNAERQAAIETMAARDAALDQTQRQIEMLSKSEEPRCPVCGEPLTDDHRAELLTRNRSRIERLEVEKADAEQVVAALAADIAEAERDLVSQEARARALPRPEEAHVLETQRADQDVAVAESAASVTAEQEALTAQQADLETLASRLEVLRPDLTAATQHVDAQQAIIRGLTEELQGLARQDEVLALTEQIDQQAGAITEAEGTVTVLSTALDDVARLSEALTALGNPRRAFDRAADVAAGEAVVAEQHAAAVAEIEQLRVHMTELNEALATYDDLDARISTTRQRLAQNTSAHQRYLQHEREAKALKERRAAVADLLSEMAAAEAAYEEQANARATVAADYDAGLHARLAEELGEIQVALAALTERLRQYGAQLDETSEAIARLETVEASRQEARSELAAQQETLALLSYLRQVLREAGPQITRALVQMISLHADRLYADIMQNYRSRLRWTEDYEIVLTNEGRERTFQQLSGGEQMAAGLAVRLALLREISTVDVAFFDEPTANLDAERRTNLAEHILNIKCFAQLFVISHDDTFEQDTDRVIRVKKENGVSVVEGSVE